jgi:hypothetical protein
MLRFDGSVWILRLPQISQYLGPRRDPITFSFASLKPWLQAGSFASNKHSTLIQSKFIFDQKFGWRFFRGHPKAFLMYKGMGTLRIMNTVFSTPH